MQRLSIAAQLYLVIGLSTVALVVVIGAALLGSSEMVAAGRNLHDRGTVAIEETSRLALLFENQEELVGRAPVELDLIRLKESRARFNALSKELSAVLTRLAPLTDTLAKNSVPRLAALFRTFHENADAVFDFAQNFVQDKASEVLEGPLSVAASQIDAILDELLNAADRTADAQLQALSNARDKMVWTIVGVSLFGVIAFNALGIYLARRLTRQLGRVIAEMSALSAGDLDSQMAAGSNVDEIGAMDRALQVFRFEMIASRQMEAEIRRSQEHLARAQRISNVGSLEQDLQTWRLKWSAESCRIFGVDPEEIRHEVGYFMDFVHPDDRAMVKAAANQLGPTMTPPPLEYRIVRRNGSVRVVYRENEVLFDETGRAVRRIITFKDITELRAAQQRERELERQLLHSQKLEALGTLAGGVAHDLNNTLVPILALSKLALEELPESPMRGDIATIIRASERARDLVKQILAFSRKQDLVKHEVDLVLVTREALKMLRASLPATIQIVEQIAEVPLLFGDAGELHQVIVNLVTNAARAIGGRVGKITVKLCGASHKQPPPHQIGSGVFLSIADTGCGMDEATVDRIFEPFFTTRGVGDGTGLGLSVVHGIVTRLGGTIAVRSEPGAGSEFTLTLPTLDQDQTTKHVESFAAA